MSDVVDVVRMDGRWHYRLVLDGDEAKALSWLAARYDTSAILYAHEEDGVIMLPEPDAWRYMEALWEENGNPLQVLPTCVGGTLAEKLLELYDEIV